jgi:tripartite-type tricarboxylate transporter receptor subunit TctC
MHDDSRRAVLRGLALLAAGALVPARAQDAYPTRTIKIIAPVQPGGGVDLVARTIGERLGKAFGQSVVVENQSGGPSMR